MLPVLLHIPHSSRHIPPEYMADYFLPPDELAAEQLRLVDLYTDELYQLDGAERAVFPVSRFLVDAERFSDDAQESMAARGMGALYTVTTDLKPLRPHPSADLRQVFLQRYYYPHHAGLNDWAARSIKQTGRALLVDCHSYPSRALPYELENQALRRPEIGIGTDPFHTPPALVDAVVSAFRNFGYDVGLNEPFAGTLTPAACYGKEPHLYAFMIELRKDIYMDEKTGAKLPAFCDVQQNISHVLAIARDTASSLL